MLIKHIQFFGNFQLTYLFKMSYTLLNGYIISVLGSKIPPVLDLIVLKFPTWVEKGTKQTKEKEIHQSRRY